MKSIEMLLSLMKHITNELRKDMIEMCDPVPFQKVTLSWFMIRIEMPWGKENLSRYGMAHTSSPKS
jgi:hypothetical protein